MSAPPANENYREVSVGRCGARAGAVLLELVVTATSEPAAFAFTPDVAERLGSELIRNAEIARERGRPKM